VIQSQIRRATAADLPALLAFEQGVVEAERPYNSRLKTGSVHYYDIAELIADKESLVLVAEKADQLIATGHGTLKSSADYFEPAVRAYEKFGFRRNMLEMKLRD